MIGIIGAVNEEANEIIKEMTNIEIEKIGQLEFFKGNFFEKNIVFVQSGIGKVNAAMTTTLLIEKFGVEKIIFSGVAGSTNEKLKIGDIVVATDIVQHDVDATEFGYPKGQIPQMKEFSFKADEKLVSIAGKVAMEEEIVFGRILTGDKFVSEKEEKITLGDDFCALCVDMESGAVAQVCTQLDVPFLVIRSISDSITDESTMEYDKFVVRAARNSKLFLKEIITEL